MYKLHSVCVPTSKLRHVHDRPERAPTPPLSNVPLSGGAAAGGRIDVVAVHRTMLVTLAPAFHGTTALLELLMSNSAIATLCTAKTWECEGTKFSGSGKWIRRYFVDLDGTIGRKKFKKMVHYLVKSGHEDKDGITDGVGGTHITQPGGTRIAARRSGLWECLLTWGRVWDLSK